MTRRLRLSTRLAKIIDALIGEKNSWSGDRESGTSIDGRKVHWLMTAQRVGTRLILLETISSIDQESRVIKQWVLAPGSEGSWNLETAEKNHEPVLQEWITDELEEVIGRLEDAESAQSFLDAPKARIAAPMVPAPSSGILTRQFRAVTGYAGFIIAFLILLTVTTLQYHRMLRLVGGINQSIGLTSSKHSRTVQSLSDNLQDLDGELEKLRDDVQREKAAFEFSRKNTAMTLRQKADALANTEYTRKRAYYYLADRIEFAASYRDIMHEISRLPEDNAQAATMMAVDRSNIKPLSSYHSTVAGLSFPVRLDGEEANGRDFMISSGFGELRPTYMGSGGYLPHLAVDIINVRNILMVTPANTIVRYPGEPGSVVAAAGGEVIKTGYSSVFGWYLELKHPLIDEWKQQFKNIENLTTYYAHLDEETAWSLGDYIKQSEKIGKIGTTGNTTGPHLHYEIRVYRDIGQYYGVLGKFDRINPYVAKL